MLNHVNVYTGIAYKDDPTILGWDLLNGGGSPTPWTRRIARFVRALDRRHLILSGPANVGVPEVDVCVAFVYPHWFQPLASVRDGRWRGDIPRPGRSDLSAAGRRSRALGRVSRRFREPFGRGWNEACGWARADRRAAIVARPAAEADPDRERWTFDLFAEVEVGRDGVLGEVHDEVADKHVEGGAPARQLEAFRHHLQEGRGQHKPRAQGHKVLQVLALPLPAQEHGAAQGIGQRRREAEHDA